MAHEGPRSPHDRYADDLAAYLLDALEPTERRDFEDHARSCTLCRAELRWMRTAVDLLPSSVEQLEPPPELRERLLQTVRAEAAEEQQHTKSRTQAARGGREAPIGRSARGRARRWSLPRFGLSPAGAAALATLAILAAGIGGYAVGNGGGDDASDTVAVRATPVEPDARATIARTSYGAVLRVQHLPVQRRGRVYEVWLVRRGERSPEPSSLFAVHRDGTGAAGIPGDLDDVETVMVTLEPEGGSASPTAQPVLRANL